MSRGKLGEIVMHRITTVIIVVLVALSSVGAVTVVAGDGSDGSGPSADITPGERLSGVVGVQDAEFEGEIAERTFGVRIAQAANDSARADVVERQLTDVEDRLESLETRLDELREARDRGEIPDGKYNAEVAKIVAEQAATERLTNQTYQVASDLPTDVLESKGINVTAIHELRERAQHLTGQDVADIARSIAGPDIGSQIGPPSDRLPGDHPSIDGPPGNANVTANETGPQGTPGTPPADDSTQGDPIDLDTVYNGQTSAIADPR